MGKIFLTAQEVESVCSRRPLILTAPSKGAHPVYYVLGQTFAGRFLLIVVIYFGQGKGFVVTARNMTDHERRRFSQWNNR